ncbi:MAG: hypothetical protein J6O90_03945 [Candidatus Methanomethylophilaceae archaeon]|nr:hypothetical protein [Candidatus Methanomethylophilaceae archaeon]
MRNMKIDGYDFEGPYVAGKDQIPAINGIALICSEAGEGVKILAIEQADDLSQLSSSPEYPNWKDHAYRGVVDVFVLAVDPAKRDSITQSLIYKRKSSLVCQKFEAIVDDW